MGVGYICGPRVASVLFAGSVMSWLVLQPCSPSLVNPVSIALQEIKLGFLKDLGTAGDMGGWDPITRTFADPASRPFTGRYIRQIGAGRRRNGRSSHPDQD